MSIRTMRVKSVTTGLRSPCVWGVVTTLAAFGAGCDPPKQLPPPLQQNVAIGGADLLIEFRPSTLAKYLGLVEATLVFARVRLKSADGPGDLDLEIPLQQVDFVRGGRIVVPAPPVGRYSGASLIAADELGHWSTGANEGSLAAPSAAQSGLKLHTPTFEVPLAASGLRTRVEIGPEGASIKAAGPKGKHDKHDDKPNQGQTYRLHPVVHAQDIALGVSLPGGAELSGALVGEVHEVVFGELPEEDTWLDLGDGHRVQLARADGCTPEQTVWLARVRSDEAVIASDTIVAYPHQTLCGEATLELPTGGRDGGEVVRNNVAPLATTIDGDVARTTIGSFSQYNYQSCAEVPVKAGGWCLDLGEDDHVIRDLIYATCEGDTAVARKLCTACTEVAGKNDSCTGSPLDIPANGELCFDDGNTPVRQAIRVAALARIDQPSPISMTAATHNKGGLWETDLAEGDGQYIRAAAKAVPDAIKVSRAHAIGVAADILEASYGAADAATFATGIVDAYAAAPYDMANLDDDSGLLAAIGVRAQCREFQERTALDAGAEQTFSYDKARADPLALADHRAGMGFYRRKDPGHAGVIARVLYDDAASSIAYQIVESNFGGGFNQPGGQPPMARTVGARWLGRASFDAEYVVRAFDDDPGVDPGVCEAPDLPPADCGFPDTDASASALGAKEGADAADKLKCKGVLEGYPDRCLETVDSKTKETMCPDEALAANYPGSRVMCGSCIASRVEQLAFGVKALLKPGILASDVVGCAADDKCPSWELCEEAVAGDMLAQDWSSDYIGWAMAPGREYFRGDGVNLGDKEVRPCRPHDGALWIEAASFLARLSGADPAQLNADIVDVSGEVEKLEADIADGCEVPGVLEGSDWWTPAVVALHNAGLYCMPEVQGKYSANICGTGGLGDCHATRYVMATVVARMRGDIPPAFCEPIETSNLECP